MIDVFVYGTLLTGEPNHGVVKPYLKVVQPGRVRGRLVNAGRYPALILDPNGQEIEGEWYTVTGAGLKAMDELEGYTAPGHAQNLYERTQVQDLSNGRSGWVYVWESDRGCPEIPEGSWRAHKNRV